MGFILELKKGVGFLVSGFSVRAPARGWAVGRVARGWVLGRASGAMPRCRRGAKISRDFFPFSGFGSRFFPIFATPFGV